MTLLIVRPAWSQEDDGSEAGIADNSFLIEEAFNQEPGVVQHIFNFVPAWENGSLRSHTFDLVFTQEWPVFSQRHQLSYTIPMRSIRTWPEGGPAEDARGWGDIFLNYRLQVWDGKGDLPAFAPRVSFIFPSGEEERGLGAGQFGYQFNLPFSKQFERWATHFNAGLTLIPGVTAGVDPELPFLGRDINGYHVGGSVIRFLRPNLHLMLEALAHWDEELDRNGTELQRFEMFLSPGVRWAPYTEGDTQWVLGIGVPIGLTPDAPDIAAFFYMSFEHRVCKERR
jgi:hypothetical protein